MLARFIPRRNARKRSAPSSSVAASSAADHESIGHPIELDQSSGQEANFAGTSFLTLDQLNQLQYASSIVNVARDARLDHGQGLGTFAYDDEGVPAQCTDIIKNGKFRGYLSNRETAHLVGLERSSGTMRTESWNRLPIIRMTKRQLAARHVGLHRSDCRHARRNPDGDESLLVHR